MVLNVLQLRLEVVGLRGVKVLMLNYEMQRARELIHLATR